jgi:hypothetical protein
MSETPVDNKITLTYDECDLDMGSVQHARRTAIRSLIESGVSDLNTVTPEQFDRMFAVFKLAYENRLAARNHQFGLFQWRMVWTDPQTGATTEQVVKQ